MAQMKDVIFCRGCYFCLIHEGRILLSISLWVFNYSLKRFGTSIFVLINIITLACYCKVSPDILQLENLIKTTDYTNTLSYDIF